MPAERAGYTVTIFLIDISPSMGKMREVELPPSAGAERETIEMTNLEWSLQFVMLKIQEMIFNGRKTDQCGIILFGTEDTDNIINEKNGGYENVTEFIPISQPSASTLAKLASLEPSTVAGDPLDALIVGIETQHEYLASKKTWTRKMVLLTDGENPIEVEDWEATVKKMNALETSLTIVGVDFDDDELPFHEDNKSTMKSANETFYHTFVSNLDSGVVGNCDFALRELSRPDIKQTKSALIGTVLRLGDVDVRPEEAVEVHVKTSKCTALARPKSWKRFARRVRPSDEMGDEDEMARRTREEEANKAVYAQLRMHTEYYIEKTPTEEGAEEEIEEAPEQPPATIEKENLVRGFKYGASYAPCPDGQFERLKTRKGINICGFFAARNLRQELAMGEVQYIWADPDSAVQQAALSSIVQAMYEKGVIAIAKWVSRDGMDPKMGVLSPCVFEEADCLLWVQMPFADDVRSFPFASLDTLITKSGEVLTKHPYLPNEEQMEAMENFVDTMDLMEAGEKDEDGNRQPWFDTRLSYNPAIHRTKQALFHSAIVPDITTHPLPPPHPELLKYFEPPQRVLKRAHDAIEECKQVFKVKEVPKKVARTRKDDHVLALDEGDETILLDKMPRQTQPRSQLPMQARAESRSQQRQRAKSKPVDSETESESENDQELILGQVQKPSLPTPTLSPSPAAPDSRRAPGRIVGSAYPLADFRKNIERGDVVSKAVEDLAFVVKEIVLQPFSSRRNAELLDCMKELRQVALEEDEIDAWNVFLRDLRKSCIDNKPGNPDFWAHVKELGREMSLISKLDAARAGGKSNISEAEAIEFIQK
ncbi:ATP-dependent DNA helicase II subunit 2 [Grifola frondosa]|uniref:ATP-dependent DNA helicase II subunit 2 n=1 Tax=Grifola frondosa TaxID=5627 RepID=A0A1C7MT20_GRIFR|nr:ATP-dependent DNA helicase II subunit 2 [Grifola frondosa]